MATPLTEAENRTGNLFDYINWRGDIPMSVDPFNEVDNLVLSAVIYAVKPESIYQHLLARQALPSGGSSLSDCIYSE